MRLSDFLLDNAKIVRDGSFNLLCKISDSILANALTFIEDEKNIELFKSQENRFSCLIIRFDLYDKVDFFKGGIILSETPKATFIQIHNQIPLKELFKKNTIIGRGTTISQSASISQQGIIIGNNVTIEDNVRIYPGVKIGDNTVIKYGALIGCSDYERCRDKSNHIVSATHQGILEIGKNVNVDEYVIIDRPLFAWDVSTIGDYSYIGKKAYIAHGSKVGKNALISPNVIVCGNTTIKDDVTVGVGAIIGSRITIEQEAKISLGSVVNKSVATGERVTGNLAIPHDCFMKHLKGMLQFE